MPGPDDYQRGVANGQTQATMDDLDKKLDYIVARLDRLPCGKRGEDMAALKARVDTHWWLHTAELAALIGLAARAVFF